MLSKCIVRKECLWKQRVQNIFRMCLIGRPNVGKSTMFNYLAGENIAIADNKAGLT